MNKFATILITLIMSFGVAAQDSDFSYLTMNGLAAYEQLRKEYYIGGLYMGSIGQDPSSILYMSGKKRMEIRITINKWSPRRFSQQWNQAILINNDQEALQEFSDEILAFTSIPKKDLVAGDRIFIDMDPETGTTVYLNSQKALKTTNNAFFELLLNCWIGPRPPSSDFKNHILTLPTDSSGTELLVRYEGIAPSAQRKKQVARWFNQAKKEKNEADNTTDSSPALPPPSLGTVVTAKAVGSKTTSSNNKTKLNLEKVTEPAIPAPVTEAPAPKIELAKPTLNTPPETNSENAAEAGNKAAPKSKPAPTEQVPATSQEPIEQTAQEDPQDGLLKAYLSNVLKLTYLNTQYPARAMNNRIQGIVKLKVKVSRKGKLISIDRDIAAKSQLLNKAAERAVKKAAPFPAVPKNLKGDDFEFILPFNFKL